MKSISTIAKEEIISLTTDGDCCLTAMLSAIIHTAGAITFNHDGIGVLVSSGCASTRKIFRALIKRLYDCVPTISGREMRVGGDRVFGMLCDLGIITYADDGMSAVPGINDFLIMNKCCKTAYLKGVFLGAGSLSIPKQGYHLEIAVSNEVLAGDIVALIEEHDIECGIVRRKDKYVVYVKGADMISDTLALMGANRAVLQLNDILASRQVKQQTNRRYNCDLANLDKTVDVSMRQTEAINKLKGKLKDEKLREMAEVRLSFPVASYNELATKLNISKSAVKYRLKKLIELSEE